MKLSTAVKPRTQVNDIPLKQTTVSRDNLPLPLHTRQKALNYRSELN